VTRAEIEAVRGVTVNPNIIRTVIERNWVRVVGHRDLPGHPELLGTTREFLDYFGLRSLDELPPLAELRAMADVNLQLGLGAEDPPGGAAAASDVHTGLSVADAADADEGAEDDGLTADPGPGAGRELVAGPRDLEG
jgi:segregation and condensation protein B